MFQTKKRYTLLLHSYRKAIPEIISRVSSKISAFSWTKMGFRRSEVQRSSHKFVPPVFCSLPVSLFLLFLSEVFTIINWARFCVWFGIFECVFIRQIDILILYMFDWLLGWLNSCLVGCSVVCPIIYPVACFFGLLVGLLIDLLVGWLPSWLVGWLIRWLIGLLVCWFVGSLVRWTVDWPVVVA